MPTANYIDLCFVRQERFRCSANIEEKIFGESVAAIEKMRYANDTWSGFGNFLLSLESPSNRSLLFAGPGVDRFEKRFGRFACLDIMFPTK